MPSVLTTLAHTNRTRVLTILLGLSLVTSFGFAQSSSAPTLEPPVPSVPTFLRTFRADGKQYHSILVGHDPSLGGTTTLSTEIVPVTLSFHASTGSVKTATLLDASESSSRVAASPIFQKYNFLTGNTQYGDAVQRAQFYDQIQSLSGSKSWHTLLSKPAISRPIIINVPKDKGYLLRSKRTGRSLAVVDLKFIQEQLFQTLQARDKAPHGLIIALTKNTLFYALNDATVCCSWGAHGTVPGATMKPAQSYILSTYLDDDAVPLYADIQALSEQLIEWMNDPLANVQPNLFPAWKRPPDGFGCGGSHMGTPYRFAEPTDEPSLPNATQITLGSNTYHLENVALLSWFAEDAHPSTFQGAYSFPDTRAQRNAAVPCHYTRRAAFRPTVNPVPASPTPNGHQLIGYWAGHDSAGEFPLRDVSPQWDVVIVAFASPVKGSTSRLHFQPPIGQTEEQFKSDVRLLQNQGRKVLISLGGGGEVVTLNTPVDLQDFATSVSAIVKQYGFDGIDLDLETPSLILDRGDTDFRHPTTRAIVNLITALQRLHHQFGPKFMIAEVPEGPQVPAGMVTYGGQFGSFLPVIYGTRDILSFVDVQNYNTPPLEGLDENYFMPGTADYYVAMTELLLHGFPVAGNKSLNFPPLRPEQVAIGFLIGPSQIPTVKNALHCLIAGKPDTGMEYTLQRPAGYHNLNGAMYWNIQSDRRENYEFSNAIGPSCIACLQ